jgi:hypothetical protein
MIQVNEDKKIFVNIVCKFKDSNNNYLHWFNVINFKDPCNILKNYFI